MVVILTKYISPTIVIRIDSALYLYCTIMYLAASEDLLQRGPVCGILVVPGTVQY